MRETEIVLFVLCMCAVGGVVLQVAAVTEPLSFVKLGLYNSRKLSLWHVSLRTIYYKPNMRLSATRRCNVVCAAGVSRAYDVKSQHFLLFVDKEQTKMAAARTLRT